MTFYYWDVKQAVTMRDNLEYLDHCMSLTANVVLSLFTEIEWAMKLGISLI